MSYFHSGLNNATVENEFLALMEDIRKMPEYDDNDRGKEKQDENETKRNNIEQNNTKQTNTVQHNKTKQYKIENIKI